KSTTRARDGLYTYDAVARLRDAQLVGAERLQEYLNQLEVQKLTKRLKERTEYREFGALGHALQHTDCRPIILIDEIDKADSDFPNDLLLELEELRFEIPETEEKIPAVDQTPLKPIIIITSNCEKPLPEPFLRRCLYFFVEFPDEDLLLQIIDKRFRLTLEQDQLVAKAVDRFYEIRDLLKEQPGNRPPGTSEFLEFLAALLNKSHHSLAQAQKDLENLANRKPLLGTLLKTQRDQRLYQEAFSTQDE
ncbi:MAG: MoxR family ATPase, partial [Merismopedia sp. SIO2A8]|nr:MoxR family ATPase [Merismopedia sp. SIO2A8]